MSKIFGAIGYTILKNKNSGKKMLIFADMHDHLERCNNSIIISDWLKKKILNKNKNTTLILEEIPRQNKLEGKIKELWSTSLHTQKLKELSIEYSNVVNSIDIRTFLIPFNLEIAKPNDNDYKVKLRDYLVNITNFFNKNFIELYNDFLKNKNYKNVDFENSNLGKHFNLIKSNYNNLLNKYYNVMDKFVTEIINTELITDVEKILSDIMEFNVCVHVMKHINERIIIHVGLAHSEKIIQLLTSLYEYKKVKEVGINRLAETEYIEINGCHTIIEHDILE